ncbi:MAG: 30S ribosomal protein S6--L-glutamate ligase, partial [Candidatus Thermoplasmatota archaeon]|nr:30S ribosomal protein S6--L-glutamate ligase [Candidatus Thermoplasmatota archaeon]
MDPRLVILSKGPGLYSTKRLVEEAEAAGWAARIIDPLSLDYVIDDNGVRIYKKGWPVECEAVLPRIGHSIRSEGVRVVSQFESTGAIVINKSAGIWNSHDKMRSCKLMSDAG